MPTRRGRILIVSGAACFAGARALGVDALYVLAVAGVAFPALAALVVWWAEHWLEVTRSVSHPRIFAGEPLRIEVTVRNPARLASPPLLLEDRATASIGGPIRLSLPSMASGVRERVVVERRPAARGRYAIGPLDALLLDPFGLASVRRTLAPESRFVVYPRIESLHAALPAWGAEGWGVKPRAAPANSGDEFYAVREWRDGDDLRRIHWPSVARTGAMMIRQNEARPFMRATVVVDTRRRPHRGTGPASSLEWSLSAAASAIWHLAARGFILRLATAERQPSAPAAGRRTGESLLEALATVRPGPDRTILPMLRELSRPPGAGGALLAILPPPGPQSAAELGALARLRTSYAWCGAVLLDAQSFADPSPRARAEADQRLADATRSLAGAGWAVATAGARNRFGETWNELLAHRGFRPSSASRPS